MTPRDEIVALHQRLYQRQRRLLAQSVHGAGAGLRAYEATYLSRVRSFARVIPYDEVVRQLGEADVAYVGDYHTLKQAQRSFMKLARRLVEQGRPLVLALEFVQGKAQRHLDAWLAGRIDEETFLSRIGYRRHQIFDVWPNFKPIFDLAREHQLRIVAIDRSRADLGSRDIYAAKRIAAARAENSAATILVLIGQLHCAPSHLPRAVARVLAARGLPPARPLVVYQNAEPIYWDLSRRGLEHEVEAVEIRPGELNLVNTPPTVAQQSYLDWVDADLDDESLEAEAASKHFKEMARLVAGYLDLDLANALDEVQVFTAGDLSFLEGLAARGDFSARELALIRRQILARESYFIPRARAAYLANLSLNHAAEEAAHFVRHVVSGGQDEPRGLVDGFYTRALEEAYAFFGSKIVNPRRKCAHEEDFARLARGRRKTEQAIARAVLQHKRLEHGQRARGLTTLYQGAGADLFHGVTHALGYILGEKLYYAMLGGLVNKAAVRKLFLDPLEESGDALRTYFELTSKLSEVRVPKRA